MALEAGALADPTSHTVSAIAQLTSNPDTLSLSLPASFQKSTGWTAHAVPRSTPNRDLVPVVATTRHVAFPGICKTKSGRLLVVYRDGLVHASGKQDEDGRAMMAESTDLGRTWSNPWLIYDDPEVDDRNSALLCTSTGAVVHVWNKYLDGRDFGVFLAISRDEGRTWTAPVKVGNSSFLRTRNSPIEVRVSDSQVEWLVPLYDCMSAEKAAYIGVYHPETGASEVYPVTPVGERNISDEWALAQAADGRLIALIRSNWDPLLWQAESLDRGRTWQRLRRTNIPSQFTPPDLIRLHDGRLLVTFSFRERCNERQAISQDNGESWQVLSSVDVYDATLRGDRSYPAAVQLDDKTIGTVLYETLPAPQGGRIWFAKTRLDDFDREASRVWYSQVEYDDAQALLELPSEGTGTAVVAADYRFGGDFGKPLNGIELLLEDAHGRSVRAGYWMGGGRDESNLVQVIMFDADGEQVSMRRNVAGILYNDGNNHQISLVYRQGEVGLAIDGVLELTTLVPNEFTPVKAGVSAQRASVALFGLLATRY